MFKRAYAYKDRKKDGFFVIINTNIAISTIVFFRTFLVSRTIQLCSYLFYLSKNCIKQLRIISHANKRRYLC